jgi:hypothetical protein
MPILQFHPNHILHTAIGDDKAFIKHEKLVKNFIISRQLVIAYIPNKVSVNIPCFPLTEPHL